MIVFLQTQCGAGRIENTALRVRKFILETLDVCSASIFIKRYKPLAETAIEDCCNDKIRSGF